MRSEDLREAIKAEPFEPFLIRMGDGREYRVPHPEFILLTPSGRMAIVVLPNDAVTHLDTMLITSLLFDKKRNGRSGKGHGGKRKSA